MRALPRVASGDGRGKGSVAETEALTLDRLRTASETVAVREDRSALTVCGGGSTGRGVTVGGQGLMYSQRLGQC